MNANLLSLSLDVLGGNFPTRLGSFLRETPSTTRAAIDSLLPVVIGTLAHKGGTLEGSSTLISLVRGAKLDLGSLDRLGTLFEGPIAGVNDLLKSGTTRIVPALFGEGSAALVSAISATSGIRRSSATTLIAMTVPIVLVVLWKHMGDGFRDAPSVSSLLQSQRANVRTKMDRRITGALGFARPVDLLDGVVSQGGAESARPAAEAAPGGAAAREASHVVGAAATGSRTWLTRWLPWRLDGSERRA